VGPVSSTSDLTRQCLIIGCNQLAVIRVDRKGHADVEGHLCTMHYFRLLARMREEGMNEDGVNKLGNGEMRELVGSSDFKRLVKQIVEHANFKAAVKKAIKKGKKKWQEPRQGRLWL